MTLLLLLLVPNHALASSVVLDGPTWQALQPEADPEPAGPPAPVAATRTVQLVPGDEGLEVRARWEIVALEPGWYHADLTAASLHVDDVRWNGRRAAVTAEGGRRVVTGWVDGRATLVLTATADGDPSQRPVTLDLMPAIRGTVEVRSGDLEPRLSAGDGRGLVPAPGEGFWTGAARMELFLAPPTTAAREDLVMGTAGLGLTFGEGEVRGRARLAWEVRQGEVDAVSFTLSGAGADLQVEGPNIRAWRRSGDRVAVDLQQPVDTVQRLEVSWSDAASTAAESRVALPTIRLDGAWRTATSLQLARDGEVEVVPDLTGWEARTASTLPPWGQGLVQGTPTSAWEATSRSPGGAVDLLRFEPVPGPAVVVDVASYTAATTDEGRLLVRAHYEVRNERSAHLRVVPPAGMRMVGARVAGETATPVTDEGEGWLVPLQRSVETVEGLLSFPIEVTLVGEQGGDWERREERTLELPRVDAPVAAARLTVHLPPGYTSRLEAGEHEVVDSFTEGEGITYGFGVGDVGAAAADALFQGAVSAWMGNDFQAAQQALDDLREMGASNENIARLQANLDVVEGRYEVKGKASGASSSALSRRVKEQAKARSVEEQIKQKDVKKKARESAAKGDYEEAETYYREAIELSTDLGKLEQDEAVEFKSEVDDLQAELNRLQEDVHRAKANLQVLHEVVLDGAVAAADEGEQIGVFGAGLGGGGVAGGEEGWDYLDRVPAGRDYQAATGAAAGVLAGDDDWGVEVPMDGPVADPAPEPEYWEDEVDYDYELDYAHTTSETVVMSRRRPRLLPRLPSLRRSRDKTPAASPAPPPAPPRATIGYRPPPPVTTPTPTPDPSAAYGRKAEEKRVESERFLKDLLVSGEVDGERRGELQRRLVELEADRRAAEEGERQRIEDRRAQVEAAQHAVTLGPVDQPVESTVVVDPEAARWVREVGQARADIEQALGRAGATPDPDVLQCLKNRAASARVLHDIAGHALQAMATGDPDRADHERRKISVARDKASQLRAEADQCHAPVAVATTVSVERSRRGLRGLLGRARTTTRTEIDFEGLEVSGELVKPQGQLVKPQGSIQLMPDDGNAPQVTAAALSVVVPSAGEAVRYQHLLLPADAPQAVLVRAKRIKE